MRDLDDTDMELLRLLVEDGRRTYADLAEAVGLSAPAVRDRIDRLQEDGVIRRFTADVDRSKLRGGIPVLVTLDPDPADVEAVRAALVDAEAVEHVFVTADASLLAHARVPDGDVRGFLADALDGVPPFSVDLLTDARWTPGVEGTGFALECAECGNTVTAEGESARIDGSLYHFCCPSCRERFADRYEELDRAAD